MKKKSIIQILFLCCLFILGYVPFFSLSQYYYFDSISTTYPAPYKQGCTGTLAIRINTQSHPVGARAGLLRLIFDPSHISYDLSLTGMILRNTLFIASNETFMDWTSNQSPSWVPGTYQTQLQIDRKNNLVDYKGSGGLYGTIIFVPVYSGGLYTGYFSLFYDGNTDTTSLSQLGGINIINPLSQILFLTGLYGVIQEPCVSDTISPLIDVSIPSAGTKKSYLSGILLSLTDNASQGLVPYVWTGGGIWTGNIWGITNQYGINLSSFIFTIYCTGCVNGNGTGRVFTGGQFDTGNIFASLSAIPYGKTWQFFDKNYSVKIVSGELFDYGIEKPIFLSGYIQDRKGNFSSFFRVINQPVPPSATGIFSPSPGERFVNVDAPIKLGIKDDWAGVDSSSIVITLSGLNVPYGPYRFTGSALNLIPISGEALSPDYLINISNHLPFPSSGTINVSVYALDKAGNVDVISDYSFSTRPSCAQLGCCNQIFLQTKTVPFLYNPATITISGGIDPKFYVDENGTGYIDCNLPVAGISLYRGKGLESGNAQLVGFFDGNELIFSGINTIKAVLDGDTLYLSTVFVPPPFTPGGGGGGGGGTLPVLKDNCLSPGSSLPGANASGLDLSPSFYDNTCEALYHKAASLGCPVLDSPYDDELTQAFQEAYDLGITNKCPIENARLKDFIKRKELVKMLVFFSVKVLGVMPDTTKIGCDKYADMKNASEEMKFYAKIGCQLEIMGMEADGVTPMKNFFPEQEVTRAQFGTTLSRLIFGRKFNAEKPHWYSKHLQALKKFRIIKVTTPSLKETRGFIMLMFKRTRESGLVEQFRLSAAAKNGVVALKGGEYLK